MFKTFMAVMFAAVLSLGCASTSVPPGPGTKTPAATVFQVKSNYAAALTAAVAYKRLPTCSETVKMPCKDVAIVAQLQKADNVAFAAIDAAETAVRSPAMSQDAMSKAVTVAQSALSALVAITGSLATR